VITSPRIAARVSRLLKIFERSTKSHEATRKDQFVRVVSCSFVDRLILPENTPTCVHQPIRASLIVFGP